MEILGIDIGASGVKGAPVDTRTGDMTAERLRTPTPEGAEPEAVSQVVAELVRHFSWSGPHRVRLSGRGAARPGAHRGQYLQELGWRVRHRAVPAGRGTPGHGD